MAEIGEWRSEQNSAPIKPAHVPLPVSYLTVEHLRCLPYEQYLQTPHWRKTRHRKLAACGWRCEQCPSKGNLQVHHRSYRNLGCEPDEDLAVLCRTCHETFHFKESFHEVQRLLRSVVQRVTAPSPVGPPLTREESQRFIAELVARVKVPSRSFPNGLTDPKAQTAAELHASWLRAHASEPV